MSIAVFFVLGAACVEDAGMLDGICGPIVLPMEVLVEPTSEADEAVDEAVALWNDASILDLFVVGDPSRYDGCAWMEDGCPGTIIVWSGATVDPDALGEATLYDHDGEVVRCEVTLTSLWPAEAHIVAHELGHCLGLDDDPESLDLGSIMSDPQHDGDRPTAHDVDIVLEGCDAL